jgi:hypothetical protein
MLVVIPRTVDLETPGSKERQHHLDEPADWHAQRNRNTTTISLV